MVTIKGREAVRHRLRVEIPEQLEKIARGAARAGGRVIADEARLRCRSDEVRASIKLRVTDPHGGVVTAKIQTIGKGAYIAPWLEYGTAPHYITVNDAQRQGLSVGKVNQKGEFATLLINGKPAGPSVFHPGATPHPFLRPALDARAQDALAAAQSYIDSRTKR